MSFTANQRRIQDFPEGAPTPEGGANLLFGITFVENYENQKNWTDGGVGGGSRTPKSTSGQLSFSELNSIEFVENYF